jgi:hypothetical protein
MAEKRQGYEYEVKTFKNGKQMQTLTIVMYAPDGSIFKLPHGGDPATYLHKGFKSKPDGVWNALNAEYEAEKAASLKRSNFQRDIKSREIQAAQQEANISLEKRMRELDESMAKKEAELEDQAVSLDLPIVGKKRGEKPKTKA